MKINQTYEWVHDAMNYVHAKIQIQQKFVHGETKKTNPYMNRCGFADPGE
jgi:hypothetical protein